MDPKELFRRSVESVNGCIGAVKDDELGNKTPCSEWDLKALLNHLVYEILWVPDIVAGKTIAEVGDKYDGDVLWDDPVEAWNDAINKALQAVEACDLNGPAHLSYAETTNHKYITEIASDVLIHGWDVGQSINCSVIFDRKLAQVFYDIFLPRQDEMVASGAFGTAIDTSGDASIQTKLLALFGRKAEG